MSFLGSMFSGSSGYSPEKASILKPATVDQANEQYGHVNTGLDNQAAFLQAVQGQNGLQNQANVFQQQQQLANNLQGQVNGTGPNPAMAQLNQQTSNNTANQAALMAGQRGTGANAGLMSRQAANVGAQNQQQAVGQGATLQAQQQLAAQQQLQQQQAQMQNVAGNQINTQGNAANAYAGSAQNALNSVYGQINAQNSAELGRVQLNNQGQMQQHTMDNAMGMDFLSKMGQAGMAVAGMPSAPTSSPTAAPSGGQTNGLQGFSSVLGQIGHAHGGMIDGPKSLAGQHLKGAKNMKSGGPVSGQASVKGDSYSNDTVPAMLSPGEIVIPRHITQGADAAQKAAAFVQAILARGGK